MCKECDNANGTDLFEEVNTDSDTNDPNMTEREQAEQEVSPQTNATMTVLTPGPDAGIPSEPAPQQ